MYKHFVNGSLTFRILRYFNGQRNLFWSEIVLICSCYCYTLPIYKNTVDRGASRDQSVLFHNYSAFTRWYNNICDFIWFISKMLFVHQHQTSSSTFYFKKFQIWSDMRLIWQYIIVLCYTSEARNILISTISFLLLIY